MIRKFALYSLIAVLLAAGTLLLLRPAPTSQAEAIEPVIPSQIERIAVAGDDLRDGSARRLAPGEWSISLADSRAQWPGSAPAVRSSLRALAEIAALEPAPPAEFAPVASVTLRTSDGQERRFEFAPAVIGGRRTVVIDAAASVSAPAPLVDLVIAAGPAGWRDPLAFPGFGADVSRLLIEQPAGSGSPDREIDIKKTAGRWLIMSPHLARASAKAVDAAIARVLGASIVRFVDEPLAPELTGLADPAFTLTLETDEERRTVRFGAPAGASGLERFATTGEPGVLVVVDTALLDDLRLDPAAYAERRVVQTPPADVSSILIEPTGAGETIRASRTLSGWTSTVERFDPGALLELLTAAAGVTVAFEPPDAWAPLAEVTLQDLSGDPLEVVVIGAGGDAELRAASRLPGGEPVYFSVPGLTPERLALPAP